MTLTYDETTHHESHERGEVTCFKATRAATERDDEILTAEALEFLGKLHARFAGTRWDLLAARIERQRAIAEGNGPRFNPSTWAVREDATWQVAGHEGAPGLERRTVEITGPTDPKMTINALNSTANVWLADAEDASSPTWENVIGGQLSLKDAIRGELSFTSGDKHYALRSTTLTDLPTIVFRPRGWHLTESHLQVRYADGSQAAASASLVDFGLYFFHNAAELVARGRGPYFYLPKMESAREARLWNEVFEFAQDELGIPRGTIRATMLIETLTAAFEMDEILYELREHAAGLNAGRWDYLFSVIKNLRTRGEQFVLPDRSKVTMEAPFMRAYTSLLVQTCHRRGAHAMGGMSAFIPDRKRPDVNERALEKVSADKKREAHDGFDGTWVAHPDLIETARAEFVAVLGDEPHQIAYITDESDVTEAQILDIASARAGGAGITEEGLRTNISVGIRYIESWLRGIGAAAIDGLMEDAATAEISRSQIWQWIANGSKTELGTITEARVHEVLDDVVHTFDRFDGDRFDDAISVFGDVALSKDFPQFLTSVAYDRFLSA